MKYYIFILCLFICSYLFCSFSQKCECNGIALLRLKQTYVMLYNKPNGIVIDSIINDTIKEDYLTLKIKEIHNSFAKIEAYYTFDSTPHFGWIQLKYLGINTAKYTSSLLLREFPDKTSNVKYTINQSNWTWGGEFSITKCHKGWFYVIIYKNGEKAEGWMDPEDQCSDPYTICN